MKKDKTTKRKRKRERKERRERKKDMSGKVTLESVFSAAIIAFLWAIIISIGIVLWQQEPLGWPYAVIAVLFWGFCVVVSIVSLLTKGDGK